MDDAEIVLPESASNYQKFIHKTEPGKTSLILFRKNDTRQRNMKIERFFLPPVLSDERLQ